MTSPQEEPVSVKTFDPTWNPTKGTDGKTAREKAEADDYLDGYYIGFKENQGPEKNSMVHTIQNKKGERFSVWGTFVMNQLIADNVTPGEYIRIKWLGKVRAVKAGGKPYHTWDVLKFETVPVLSSEQLRRSKASMNVGSTASEQPSSVTSRPNAMPAPADFPPTDNLPF